MSTVIPHSELVRKALTYVDEQQRDNPNASLSALLDEAGARFNLSPKDSLALEQIFREAAKLRKSGQ